MAQRIALLLLVGALASVCDSTDRVLLSSVQTITLYAGAHTAGRRSAPVAQLTCVGGNARGRFEPTAVQCYNRGYDGHGIQWECKAEMDEIYRFGHITVLCEGYDYPDDPYILKGSCGLEYTLEYTEKAKQSQTRYDGKDISLFNSIVVIGCVLLLAFVVFKTCVGESDDTFRRAPGGGGGGGHGGGDDPPGPGWRPNRNEPPPPYEEKHTHTHAQSQSHRADSNRDTGSSQQWQPGFFTGMGTGGLLGYMFGRQGGSGTTGYYGYRPRPRHTTGYYGYNEDRPSTSAQAPPSSQPQPTGNVRSASGFGSTRRR